MLAHTSLQYISLHIVSCTVPGATHKWFKVQYGDILEAGLLSSTRSDKKAKSQIYFSYYLSVDKLLGLNSLKW